MTLYLLTVVDVLNILEHGGPVAEEPAASVLMDGVPRADPNTEVRSRMEGAETCCNRH
jgi:hypothetical protein